MDLKFSEAMRLGAMTKPQGFGVIQDVLVATCANNAAMDAISGCALSMRDAFPITCEPWMPCPACDAAFAPPFRFSANIAGNVAHLNDDHRWTREQIADWVETIEHREVDARHLVETMSDPQVNRLFADIQAVQA